MEAAKTVSDQLSSDGKVKAAMVIQDEVLWNLQWFMLALDLSSSRTGLCTCFDETRLPWGVYPEAHCTDLAGRKMGGTRWGW